MPKKKPDPIVAALIQTLDDIEGDCRALEDRIKAVRVALLRKTMWK